MACATQRHGIAFADLVGFLVCDGRATVKGPTKIRHEKSSNSSVTGAFLDRVVKIRLPFIPSESGTLP